jgi:hypothetical protein
VDREKNHHIGVQTVIGPVCSTMFSSLPHRFKRNEKKRIEKKKYKKCE